MVSGSASVAETARSNSSALAGGGGRAGAGCSRSFPPTMLILGAVIDQEEQASGGEALDEAVEQGLGLGIGPVEILADEEQGLNLAFAQQESLEAVEGALAASGSVERARRGGPPGGRRAATGAPESVSWRARRGSARARSPSPGSVRVVIVVFDRGNSASAGR